MLSIIVTVFVFCFVLERVVPGWQLPKVRTWPLRVVAINAVQLGVVLVAVPTFAARLELLIPPMQIGSISGTITPRD